LLLCDDEGLNALCGLASAWIQAGEDIPAYPAAVDRAIVQLRNAGKKELGL
jgi:hypothetical protein